MVIRVVIWVISTMAGSCMRPAIACRSATVLYHGGGDLRTNDLDIFQCHDKGDNGPEHLGEVTGRDDLQGAVLSFAIAFAGHGDEIDHCRPEDPEDEHPGKGR